MPGPFPDRALVRPGQQLHRISQVAVPGDRAVVVAIEAYDLGEHMSVSGVALGAGGRVPIPVTGGRERVDREDLIAGRAQRTHPRATVGFDAHHNLTDHLFRY